jgi:hypothetical protein
MPQYKDKMFEDIYVKYNIFFEQVRSDNFSKNQLREQNNEITNWIKEYAETLRESNKIETSLEYKKENVKEALIFELRLNEIAMLNTDSNLGAYKSLEEARGHLDNAIDTYDRDMVDSDNYQAVYTRNKRKKALVGGLPRDDVVFLLNSQSHKIKMEEVGLGSHSNPFYEINIARNLVITEIAKMYKEVQSSLLKDVLPKEQEKPKKKRRNDLER